MVAATYTTVSMSNHTSCEEKCAVNSTACTKYETFHEDECLCYCNYRWRMLCLFQKQSFWYLGIINWNILFNLGQTSSILEIAKMNPPYSSKKNKMWLLWIFSMRVRLKRTKGFVRTTKIISRSQNFLLSTNFCIYSLFQPHTGSEPVSAPLCVGRNNVWLSVFYRTW